MMNFQIKYLIFRNPKMEENLIENFRNLRSFSENDTILISVIFSIIILSALFNIITAYITKGSYQSVFSLINFCQIMLFIPLTSVYTPSKITEFIRSMRPSLFSFYHFNWSNTNLISDFIGKWQTTQTNTSLNFIGLENASTYLNSHIVMNLLAIILIIHIILLPVNWLISKNETQGCFGNIVKYSMNYLSFTFYIRFFLEIYLLLSLASISEIKRFKTSGSIQTRSFIFAIFTAAFLVLILVISVIHWQKYGIVDDFEESKLKSLYSGLNPERYARSFNILFMTRRFLFVIVLILAYNADRVIKISILSVLQLGYSILLLLLRPFESRKDNILEIINELGFLVICSSLIYLYKNSHWKTSLEWLIWSLILAILIAFLIVSFGKW